MRFPSRNLEMLCSIVIMSMATVFSAHESSVQASNTQTCIAFGNYVSAPVVSYSCGGGAFSVSISEWVFQDDGRGSLIVGGVPTGPPTVMTGSVDCSDTTFTVSTTGFCLETHTLTGDFTSSGAWEGVYTIDFQGTGCYDCTNQQFVVSGSISGPSAVGPSWVGGGPTLEQNFPNPFNPNTMIIYSLATPGPASIRIYDVSGRLIKTLVDGYPEARTVYFAMWDGRNDEGRPVPTGIYFCTLTTSTDRLVRKMMLLR